jgi:pimeloyl-ACP methyl ester carboxylesterase
MNYTRWAADNLTKTTIKLRGKQVALWRTPTIAHAPTILLVHGITGDHFGLVPLVYELTMTHNCLVVELPGHGASDAYTLKSAKVLQEWFRDVVKHIETHVTLIDAVCAHSFGCTAIAGKNEFRPTIKTIMLNPVPRPSRLYAQYAQVIMRFARFWAIFYNLRAFVFMRSVTLAKVNTWESRRRIGWVSHYSRPTYWQVVYQAGLVDIILDSTAYSHVKDRMALVVCGLDDTTADQRDSLEMAEVFGASPVEFLRGGHLVPIETPERVATMIRQIV